jgi:hypothetical protein
LYAFINVLSIVFFAFSKIIKNKLTDSHTISLNALK